MDGFQSLRCSLSRRKQSETECNVLRDYKLGQGAYQHSVEGGRKAGDRDGNQSRSQGDR